MSPVPVVRACRGGFFRSRRWRAANPDVTLPVLSARAKRLAVGRPSDFPLVPAAAGWIRTMTRPARRPRLEALEDRTAPAAGDLLRAVANPAAAPGDQFGLSVAVSGNLMA